MNYMYNLWDFPYNSTFSFDYQPMGIEQVTTLAMTLSLKEEQTYTELPVQYFSVSVISINSILIEINPANCIPGFQYNTTSKSCSTLPELVKHICNCFNYAVHP